MGKDYINFITGAFLIIVASLVALGVPLMLLWNNIVPTIFGLRYITFGEAIQLNLLAHILIGMVGSPVIILFKLINIRIAKKGE